MITAVILTVDRNAGLSSSSYPGPQVEVEEVFYPDIFVAAQFLRSQLCQLGVLEGHLEDGDGNVVELPALEW